MAKSADLLQGTLDLLILRTLELRPVHGVGIADIAQEKRNWRRVWTAVQQVLAEG